MLGCAFSSDTPEIEQAVFPTKQQSFLVFDIAPICFADKVLIVKKLICHFLIVWMALFAGGANAHGISDLASGAEHAGHAHNTKVDLSVDPSIEVSAERANTDQASTDLGKTCSQSHCGHGHTGMLMLAKTWIKMDVVAELAFSSSRWASAAIADDIERPKWLFTTPAVVSLLT